MIPRSGGDAFEVGSNFDADYWVRDGKSLRVSYTAKDAGSNHVIVRPAPYRDPQGHGGYKLRLRIIPKLKSPHTVADVEFKDLSAPSDSAGEEVRSWSFWTAWNAESHMAAPAAKQRCMSESEWERCSAKDSMRRGSMG